MQILLIGSHAHSLINFRGPLIRDLIAVGHSVVAAAPDIDRDVRAKLNFLGAGTADTPLTRTGLNPLADLRYHWNLRAIIRRVKPDLVITYTIKPNIWGSLAARVEGVDSAAMVTGLGYAFAKRKGWKANFVRGVATFLYRWATNANKYVIFQNPDDRNDFIATGCLSDPSKARIVNGSGVDTEHFSPVPLPAEPVFLMISRLLISKGVREYCAAAIAIKTQRPDVRFLLVGYIDGGPDSISQGELDYWIAEGVEYWGELKDVRLAIQAASAYVLPSYREGTPRSVLEAMAMGRPIITTDAPGCRETTVHDENGLLVPVGDVAALTSALNKLICSRPLRERFGTRSRQLAVEKYDVNAVNRLLMKHLGLSA